ncbi:MAG: PhzF family phenazine biosynthesis protein [Syntrophales bacterium]|jgi:PhzF family phenazine biosynthesis protein|nr:PhzF family phenazine biosynthesis protein [Syntrophales bacterium]MDD4338394.1 PhzF family phenazine biosynthesis protein [Syntrophales bacterium]HOG06822.1 PhzF family phenazine biosynthesis protein [Syntrophales bacterium]HPB70178.1 PhzF family phenazine biosynthesis protein [Syntrophales bacterium]HQP29345.1 PhzF family phenazine biosynthesis protein [Syntrophales bacterium]
MNRPFYQVEASTAEVFSGNPAAVCLLEDWLEDAPLQAVAADNNLSETAFLVPNSDGFDLRWFTPTTERRWRSAAMRPWRARENFGPSGPLSGRADHS